MPLLLLTGPPTTTSHTTSVSVTWVARSSTRPSSMRIESPGETSPGKPLNVVEQRSTSPRMSSMVIVNDAPFTRTTGPASNRPSRIFGPCRSANTAIGLPAASAALRTSFNRSPCSA
jgi:hypothetical protein